jgi:hypothetical protein
VSILPNGVINTTLRVEAAEVQAGLLTAQQGMQSVSIYANGSVVATGPVQALDLFADESIEAPTVFASSNVIVETGTNSVVISNAGTVVASNQVLAPVLTASEMLRAPRVATALSTESVLAFVSDDRVDSFSFLNTDPSNLRASFISRQQVGPLLSLSSTATNVLFFSNGVYSQDLTGREEMEDARVSVYPNTELVFSSTNVLDNSITRGIRMG